MVNSSETLSSEFKNLLLFLKVKTAAQHLQAAFKGSKEEELRVTGKRLAQLEDSAQPSIATADLLEGFGKFLIETSHIGGEKSPQSSMAGRTVSSDEHLAVIRKLESLVREIESVGGSAPTIIFRRLK